MNRSRAATPYIRPLGAVPLGVSDAAVMERLKAAGAGMRGPSLEAARAASLVALVLGIAAREQHRLHLGADPWTVDVYLPSEQLAIRTGLSPASVEDALRLLAGARVLDLVGGAFRFAEEVFAPLGEEDELHWPAILAALRGDGTGILVCRAHALLAAGRRNEWFALPTRMVSEQTGYSSDTIRRARTRLIAGAILEERRQDGSSTQFRFAELAFGIASAAARPAGAPIAARIDSSPSSAPTSSGSPSLPSVLAPAPGFRLLLGGSSLDVPPGVEVSVEVDAAGRPLIRLNIL